MQQVDLQYALAIIILSLCTLRPLGFESPGSDEEDWSQPLHLEHVRLFLKELEASGQQPPCDFPRLEGSRLRDHAASIRDVFLETATALVTGLFDAHGQDKANYDPETWSRQRVVEIYGREVLHTNNGRFGTGQAYRQMRVKEYLSQDASSQMVFLLNQPQPQGDTSDVTRARLHRDAMLSAKVALSPLFQDFTKRHLFSMGLQGSSVASHTHEVSWMALLHGLKAWWVADGIAPDEELEVWEDPCGFLSRPTPFGVHFCVQRAGEVVHVGEHLTHVTCNLSPLVIGVGGQGQIHEWPALIRQAQDGHMESIESLLTTVADIDVSTTRGETALHRAAAFGHTVVARILLGLQANPNSMSVDGVTPLHLAAESGSEVVAMMLWAAGANFSTAKKSGERALHIAARLGHVPVADLLLHSGDNMHGSSGTTSHPLHIASRGHLQMVAFFLKARADPERHDAEGVTALHWAAAEGPPAVIEALVAARANADCQDTDGAQPIHWAAANGNWRALLALHRHGARIEAPDVKNGARPAHWAASSGQSELLLRIASELGADLQSRDTRGAMPFHYAAAARKWHTADVLRNVG